MRLHTSLRVLVAAGSLFAVSAANALPTIVYDSWTTNPDDPGIGNYIVTVAHDELNDQFDIKFTVNPWNAEGLGLFFDLGDFNLLGYTAGQAVGANNAAVGLTSVLPAGEVAVYDTDTTSTNCGNGCNLQGLAVSLDNPDLQWELIFALADQGYDGIQTFSFSINDFGLDLTNFGVAGVRAQQLCSGDDLLPGDNESCKGSDKSYGSPGDPFDPDQPPPGVPVPGTLLLLGLGLLGLRVSRRKAV